MNETDRKKLRNLLGSQWTEAELEEVLREDPELAGAAESLNRSFQHISEESLPPLRSDFTQEVLNKIQNKGILKFGWGKYLTWPRLSLASGLVAGVLLVTLLLPRWSETPVQPGVQIVRETSGPKAQKVYQIRVALARPDAKSVTLAGDFNQWNKVELKKNSEGIFWGEVTLPEGTYAYGFWINGKEWTPDPKAGRIIPDGFGGKNSLMNL